MKIFNRYFASPILIRHKKDWGVIMGNPEKDCPFYFRILPIRRMGGTYNTTTYCAQWAFGGIRKELSICFRFDVTRSYWNKLTTTERKNNE